MILKFMIRGPPPPLPSKTSISSFIVRFWLNLEGGRGREALYHKFPEWKRSHFLSENEVSGRYHDPWINITLYVHCSMFIYSGKSIAAVFMRIIMRYCVLYCPVHCAFHQLSWLMGISTIFSLSYYLKKQYFPN